MSLFDNKPITDAEVQRVVPCECTHIYGAHRGGQDCVLCSCEEFKERAGSLDLETSDAVEG